MEPTKIDRLNRDRTAASSAALTASALASAAKPRLLDQIRQAIRTRHYSPRTEETYVHWIRRFIFFHNKRHPVEIAEPRKSCRAVWDRRPPTARPKRLT